MNETPQTLSPLTTEQAAIISREALNGSELPLPLIITDPKSGYTLCGEVMAGRIASSEDDSPVYAEVRLCPWVPGVTGDQLRRIARIIAERPGDRPVGSTMISVEIELTDEQVVAQAEKYGICTNASPINLRHTVLSEMRRRCEQAVEEFNREVTEAAKQQPAPELPVVGPDPLAELAYVVGQTPPPAPPAQLTVTPEMAPRLDAALAAADAQQVVRLGDAEPIPGDLLAGLEGDVRVRARFAKRDNEEGDAPDWKPEQEVTLSIERRAAALPRTRRGRRPSEPGERKGDIITMNVKDFGWAEYGERDRGGADSPNEWLCEEYRMEILKVL